MKRFLSYIKRYVFRGLLAIIPIVLTIFVVRLLYFGIDRRVMSWIEHLVGFSIPGLGIVVTLLTLFIIGHIASNFVGRKIFKWIEYITSRIPLIKTTYQIGKQLTTSISLPEKEVFKRVVLVEFLKPGSWTIGFVTGTLFDIENNNQKLLKVYIPTPPNPTSGFILIIKESETRDPGWSIEETMKTVVSGGIIGPTEIGKRVAA